MSIQLMFSILSLLPNLVLADAPAGITTTYVSPNGVQEACVILPDIPGGEYSKGDAERAVKNCKINLYDETKIALCPKIWSSSSAVMVYKIADLNTTAKDYEATYCRGKEDKPDGVSTGFKLKFTMNQKETSGTFSPSSQLYYHVSRYFGTAVDTPVALYREMDPKPLLERVALQGLSRAPKGKIRAAWDWLVKALKDPSSYKPTDDIYVSDRTKVYGTALKDLGERYGTEINGARSAGWGVPENEEFQETAAFRALRTDGTLLDAADKALDTATKDKKLQQDLVNVSQFQMIYWMRELTEITLLDFIFSQQDRVGNIDYLWKWYYVKDGVVEDKEVESGKGKNENWEEKSRKNMADIPVPAEIAAFNPVLIQRSHLGDNDAGARVAYTNFAKRTKMLDGLKHYSAKIYTRLQNLDADLKSKGPLFQYIATNFNLTDDEIEQIVDNTSEAASIIKAQCASGALKFDLDEPKSFLLNGGTKPAVSLDCDKPTFN